MHFAVESAKLFMGDSESLFLGLSLGLLTIQSLNANNYFGVAWLIMLGIFIVDANCTLFYRVNPIEVVYQYHCHCNCY